MRIRKGIDLITSFFYLGHAPVMPGTMGSLGGLAVYLIVRKWMILHAVLIVVLFFLGIRFAGEAEKALGRKDAGTIVIDEACGMLLALFLVPFSPYAVILGFFLFRLFDILKPPPARRVEKMAGSPGIMLDDSVAALYTNVILQVIFRAVVK